MSKLTSKEQRMVGAEWWSGILKAKVVVTDDLIEIVGKAEKPMAMAKIMFGRNIFKQRLRELV